MYFKERGDNLKSLQIALFPTHIIVTKPVLRTHAQLVFAIDCIFVCDYIQEICISTQSADGSLRNFLTRQGLRKESLPVFIRYPKQLKCEYGKKKKVCIFCCFYNVVKERKLATTSIVLMPA